MTPGARTSLLDLLSVDAHSGEAAINRLAAARTPFFFIVDAWAERWVVLEISRALEEGILWNLDGVGPLGAAVAAVRRRFQPHIVSRARYSRAFKAIQKAQAAGMSYLANLSFPSALDTDFTLAEIARCAHAPFRLYVPETLAVFSPERFVRITREGLISSYPMKGTIDASLPHAAAVLLADEKEAAEHITIVDLIRNDLGMVASSISVPRYRFLSSVSSQGRRLLQASSELTGQLKPDWRLKLGSILRQLLPAGSVTGAPKNQTVRILREEEGYERGWYTGIFGCFNGIELDSAVSIRYVEQADGASLVYKSGGGITIYSNESLEYAELEAKIYVPVA